MKPLPYAETIERIKRASVRDNDGSAFVSLELHGLSCQQAEIVLRILASLGEVKSGNIKPGRVTYDIPSEVDRGR